jgi:nicotinamide-nucleotide amidase
MIEKVAILSTGDELTTGRTVDTNASYIADKMVGIGLDVVAVMVVGDYPDRITWAWEQALHLADVVVSTGGLGPTADDLTTETIGALTGRRLILDQPVADRIRQMFEAMGRVMPENNLKQARFPEGAQIIPNAMGTAPGFSLRVDVEGRPRTIIVLPGVPREMKAMLEAEVLPWITANRGTDDVYLSHVFQTFGISESALDELVAGAVTETEGRIAFRAAFPQISVRLTVQGKPDAVGSRLELLSGRMRERLGNFAYGEGDTSMEAVVGDLLRQKGRTIALAESCSGGLIGHRLTNVPGSSAYVNGGVIAYSNTVKEQQLGVRHETLLQHGAVSEETAVEMAAGVRELLKADIGLAVTGVAGPDGGTAEKPVGTVCFALVAADAAYKRRYQLWGNREWVKLLSSQVALDWVRRYLLGADPTDSGILRR